MGAECVWIGTFAPARSRIPVFIPRLDVRGLWLGLEPSPGELRLIQSSPWPHFDLVARGRLTIPISRLFLEFSRCSLIFDCVAPVLAPSSKCSCPGGSRFFRCGLFTTFTSFSFLSFNQNCKYFWKKLPKVSVSAANDGISFIPTGLNPMCTT